MRLLVLLAGAVLAASACSRHPAAAATPVKTKAKHKKHHVKKARKAKRKHRKHKTAH